MNKNILIIGSGGREHALAWKLKQSPKVGKIFIAPGNAGTAALGENIDIKATDISALADFAQKNSIGLTVVGPDDALALGIVDEFQKRGLKIWGPNKAAAQIESSKAFAKELMKKNNIPTAEYQTFTDYDQALQYIEQQGAPIVIKASGLALGKGVTICKTIDEAKAALKAAMVDKIFGDAGNVVVIEEFLQGQEFSVHAFSDGKTFKLFPASQDHKAINDGDAGPNTGGMGTVAPLPWVTDELMDQVSSEIVEPALEGLKKLNAPFVGLLYPGLMAITADESANYSEHEPRVVSPFMGSIKTIEFNSRFGDPETQSYMRLLKTDLFDILTACVDGNLADVNIEWHKKSACCIILASGGYPGNYQKGLPITGIERAEKMEDVIVFHAGTKFAPAKGDSFAAKESPLLLTNGGRVLGVTAIADDLQSALNKAYAGVKLIHFDNMHYRTDIGAKSL